MTSTSSSPSTYLPVKLANIPYTSTSEGISEADIHRYHIALNCSPDLSESESMTAKTKRMKKFELKKGRRTLDDDDEEEEDISSSSTSNHSVSTPRARITDLKSIPRSNSNSKSVSQLRSNPDSKSNSKSKPRSKSRDQPPTTSLCLENTLSTPDLGSKKGRKKSKAKGRLPLPLLHATTATGMMMGTLAEGLGGGITLLTNGHGHGNGNGNGNGKKKETGVGRRDSSFFAIDDSDSDSNSDSSDEITIAPRLDGGRTIVPQDSHIHISTQSTTKRKKGEKKPKSKSKSNIKLGHVSPSTMDTRTKTETETRTGDKNIGSDTEVDTDEMDEIEIDELLPSSPVRFSHSETPTP